jgi:16S rRNA (guanine527-N7)-methyltransferase
VGAGAGFPGLPLKIALPGIRLTLLEATGKKAVFLQHVVNTLGLPNVAVVTARAEEAGRQPRLREQFDVVLARAVAVMPVLAELTLPLVKVGGLVIAAKGQDPTAEIKEAANALGVLGGRVKQILPVTVPGLEAARHLVVIKKIKPTPKQYPRRPGLPAQKPI